MNQNHNQNQNSEEKDWESIKENPVSGFFKLSCTGLFSCKKNKEYREKNNLKIIFKPNKNILILCANILGLSIKTKTSDRIYFNRKHFFLNWLGRGTLLGGSYFSSIILYNIFNAILNLNSRESKSAWEWVPKNAFATAVTCISFFGWAFPYAINHIHDRYGIKKKNRERSYIQEGSNVQVSLQQADFQPFVEDKKKFDFLYRNTLLQLNKKKDENDDFIKILEIIKNLDKGENYHSRCEYIRTIWNIYVDNTKNQNKDKYDKFKENYSEIISQSKMQNPYILKSTIHESSIEQPYEEENLITYNNESLREQARTNRAKFFVDRMKDSNHFIYNDDSIDYSIFNIDQNGKFNYSIETVENHIKNMIKKKLNDLEMNNNQKQQYWEKLEEEARDYCWENHNPYF